MTDELPARERARQTRSRVEALAVDDGPFFVACRTSGCRPEPVTGATFPTDDAAERACEAATDYRRAIREFDPALPKYDLAVYEADAPTLDVIRRREFTDERRANGLPAARETVTVAGSGAGEWLRLTDAPLVHVAGRDRPLDDEVVGRQLDAKLTQPGDSSR